MGFTCCICHDELYYRVKKSEDEKVYDRPIVATKCGHLFHNDCLRKWFSSQGAEVWTNRECPVCAMTLTVATDLIRIFTSSADEGGPTIEDYKLHTQKLEADKKELVKRLELSFLQSREVQKVIDQYKRDNERMSDQLRKRQSENSKLKTENDELKNVVINLTKSLTSSAGMSSTPHPQTYRERPRPPISHPNNNYNNLPPRFRPQTNASSNGKYVQHMGSTQQERQYHGSQQSVNTFSMSSSGGIYEETSSNSAVAQNSKGSDSDGTGKVRTSSKSNTMFTQRASGSSSNNDSDGESESGENVEHKYDQEDSSTSFYQLNSEMQEHYINSHILNEDVNKSDKEDDNSNYFPRVNYPHHSSSSSKTNTFQNSGDTDKNSNGQRTASPTKEFLEALLDDSDEVEHILNENKNDPSQSKNGIKTAEGGRVDAKTPYQGTKQCYGKYLCNKCNAKWGSSRSWANKPQMCLYCKTFVYPHAQAPLMSKDELEKKILH